MKRPRQRDAWPFAAPSWPSSSPSPGRPVAGKFQQDPKGVSGEYQEQNYLV